MPSFRNSNFKSISKSNSCRVVNKNMFSVFADDSDSDEECSKPTKKVTFKEEKKSVVLEVKELPKKQEKAVLSYASMVKKPSIPKEEPIPFLKNKKNTPSSGIINYEKFLKHNQLILKLRRGEMNWADLESDDEDW